MTRKRKLTSSNPFGTKFVRSISFGLDIDAGLSACAGELAKSGNLPCFIYNIEILKGQCNIALKHIKSLGKVYFSAKANSHMRILMQVVQAGLGIDVSSANELQKALTAGCSPENIILTGPGKTDEDLVAAIESKIGLIAVESIKEAEKLSSILRKCNRNQNILLRIVPASKLNLPDYSFSGFYCFAGSPSKYGLDQEDLERALMVIDKLPGLEILGLHVFFASGVLSQELYSSILNLSLEVCSEIQNKHSRKFQILDLGGGWGIDYQTGQHLEIGSLFRDIFRIMMSGTHKWTPRLFLELGTFIVGRAGYYCAEIIDVKFSRGQIFVIIDGGFTSLLRPAIIGPHQVTICEITNSNMPFNDKGGHSVKVQVVGNSCHPLDTLCQDVLVVVNEPLDLIGKIVVISNCGAYGEVFAVSGFQGRKSAKHLWLTKNNSIEVD